jgi:anti-anti-sigma factor
MQLLFWRSTPARRSLDASTAETEAFDRPTAQVIPLWARHRRADDGSEHCDLDGQESASAAHHPSRLRPSCPPQHAGEQPKPLEVTTDLATRRLILIGELDRATGRCLTESATTLMTINPGNTTVDLSGVTFIDAGGLSQLVRLRNNLARHRATLTAVNASPRLQRAFRAAGLHRILPTLPNLPLTLRRTPRRSLAAAVPTTQRNR